MKKKPVFGVICLAIISAVIIFGDRMNTNNSENSDVFHIRLADPHIYENGLYQESFDIKKGNMNLGLFQMEIVLERLL